MRRGHMLGGTVALVAALSLAACVPPPPAADSGLPKSGVYTVGKPYQIDGVWQYPVEEFAYDETGIGAWRPTGANGTATVNGEIYDEAVLTAAHRTLPLPSLVRVTNLDSGRSIVVRVNDRGPRANNRIIELSRRGAQLLGYEQAGTAKLRVQILAEESRQIAAAARAATPAPILAQTDGQAPRSAPRAKVEVAALPGVPTPVPPAVRGNGTAGGADIAPPTTVPGSVEDGRFLPAPLAVDLPVRGDGRLYVQVGAFGNAENLARARARLSSLGQTAHVVPSRLGRQTLQRVRVGPLGSVEAADAVLAQVLQAGLTDAKIVVE